MYLYTCLYIHPNTVFIQEEDTHVHRGTDTCVLIHLHVILNTYTCIHIHSHEGNSLLALVELGKTLGYELGL